MAKGDSIEKEWYYSNPKDKEKLGPFSFQEVHAFYNVVVLCLTGQKLKYRSYY